MPPRGGAIIQANITDKAILQASYMPYVAGGGLFVPSQQNVSMGQELLLIATLPEQSQKYALTGKVVWISPKPNGNKPKGFAIQLSGEKGLEFRQQAERILAGSLNADKPTYTM
nr:PilZ domain-containing protein [Acinetobacter qingfengensis]